MGGSAGPSPPFLDFRCFLGACLFGRESGYLLDGSAVPGLLADGLASGGHVVASGSTLRPSLRLRRGDAAPIMPVLNVMSVWWIWPSAIFYATPPLPVGGLPRPEGSRAACAIARRSSSVAPVRRRDRRYAGATSASHGPVTAVHVRRYAAPRPRAPHRGARGPPCNPLPPPFYRSTLH